MEEEQFGSKIAKRAAVTAPIMIITKPRTIYASVLLLNERKNLGPAISPTAVTKSAVPILDTIPKLLFILSDQKVRLTFASVNRL